MYCATRSNISNKSAEESTDVNIIDIYKHHIHVPYKFTMPAYVSLMVNLAKLLAAYPNRDPQNLLGKITSKLATSQFCKWWAPYPTVKLNSWNPIHETLTPGILWIFRHFDSKMATNRAWGHPLKPQGDVHRNPATRISKIPHTSQASKRG